MTQTTLWDIYAGPALLPEVGGETFDAEADGPRLGRQMRAVLDLMEDGRWRTVPEVRDGIGFGTESACSARLRDLRKDPLRRTVDRRRRGDPKAGLWEYRLVPATGNGGET